MTSLVAKILCTATIITGIATGCKTTKINTSEYTQQHTYVPTEVQPILEIMANETMKLAQPEQVTFGTTISRTEQGTTAKEDLQFSTYTAHINLVGSNGFNSIGFDGVVKIIDSDTNGVFSFGDIARYQGTWQVSDETTTIMTNDVLNIQYKPEGLRVITNDNVIKLLDK